MRVAIGLIVILVAATPATSRADNVLELAGGLVIPAGNSDWTNLAEPSPELRVGAGAIGANGLGGMLRIDWTPVSLDNQGGSLGAFGNADIAGHRFRALANILFVHRVAPKLLIGGRGGAGIDIAHASATVTVLGSTTSSADTDVGYAFELGAGVWYDLGSAQIGGEFALPIGHHDKHGNATDGNYTFAYTSYDLDFLLSVRLLSR
jgi:hypothetical protein